MLTKSEFIKMALQLPVIKCSKISGECSYAVDGNGGTYCYHQEPCLIENLDKCSKKGGKPYGSRQDI